MKATAILPVKRFGSAKTRLSERLGPEQRGAIAEAMLGDVLAALARCELIERTIVVSGEPRAIAVARDSGVEILGDDDAGHSEAATAGARRAAEEGAECVALVPGDCPLLDPGELTEELAAMRPRSVAVIADRHGSGTNGLLLSPPAAITPAFGPGSRARHEAMARAAGVDCRIAAIGSMALDLDTPEDLAEFTAILSADPSAAPGTARALAEAGIEKAARWRG